MYAQTEHIAQHQQQARTCPVDTIAIREKQSIKVEELMLHA
jgi:hypothetical protein